MTGTLVTELKKLKEKQEELSKVTSIKYKFLCSWENGRPLRPLYI